MGGLCQRALARLAVALVSLALGGVLPWLEPPGADPAHHCQCDRRAGHHDCDCPLCHAEAARAGATGPATRLPPCHLARAGKDRAVDRQASARRAAGGPTISSTCGTGDRRIEAPPAVVHFTIPSAPTLAVHQTVARLEERAAAGADLPVEPETPPPRAGEAGAAHRA